MNMHQSMDLYILKEVFDMSGFDDRGFELGADFYNKLAKQYSNHEISDDEFMRLSKEMGNIIELCVNGDITEAECKEKLDKLYSSIPINA